MNTQSSHEKRYRETMSLPKSDLAARWRAQPIVVASERLAALARERGFVDIGIARSALGEDLLEAAARRLARHRL